MKKFLIVVVSLVMVFTSALSVGASSVDEGRKESLVTEEDEEPRTDFIFYEDIPLSYELQEHLWNECVKYEVPYSLMLAVIEQESTFREGVESQGNIGLCQVNSYAHSTRASNLGLNLWSSFDNITMGCMILGDLLSRYETSSALAGYNAGEWGMLGGGGYGYAASVLDRQVKYIELAA